MSLFSTYTIRAHGGQPAGSGLALCHGQLHWEGFLYVCYAALLFAVLSISWTGLRCANLLLLSLLVILNDQSHLC